ncbi:MAG: hypothetical protein RLZZ308_406 [Candidatus Parcubacteria bacterium]|jgi:uncharacterized protein
MQSENYKKHTWIAGTIALVCIAFGVVSFGLHELDSMKYPNGQVASISVSGDGEVTAIPDIATASFTIRESGKTVPEAQKLAETKITQALKEMESIGVEKKDIKTTSYVVSPKYETQQVYCITYPCPAGKTTIIGYEVSQSVTVTIRKVDQAGEVFGLLGKVQITEISGPDFTVDDIDKVQAEAKEIAIKEAKAKAEATAKSLGVSLGSITAFSEDGAGYYPVMYRAEIASMGMSKSDAVTLPQGESTIKSRVTITYTLK